MAYKNKIEARIKANNNRLKDIEKEIENLKGKYSEIIYTNNYLYEMLDSEKESES